MPEETRAIDVWERLSEEARNVEELFLRTARHFSWLVTVFLASVPLIYAAKDLAGDLKADFARGGLVLAGVFSFFGVVGLVALISQLDRYYGARDAARTAAIEEARRLSEGETELEDLTVAGKMEVRWVYVAMFAVLSLGSFAGAFLLLPALAV